MGTITMLLVVILPAVISGVNLQESGLIPYWEEVCNTSLLFSQDWKSWEDARRECQLFGGDLVEIRSMDMNYCILRHAQHKGYAAEWYWHSANDIDDEGVYRYNMAGDFPPLPGDLILWSPLWYGSDPNGGTSQNCLLVALSKDGNAGKWSNDPCSVAYRYVCQRRL